jgi:hypothetical protein
VRNDTNEALRRARRAGEAARVGTVERSGGLMAGFVQIIEFRTSRIDEVRALGEKYRDARATSGDVPVQRATFTEDRDRPGYYLNIIEFPSYEAAMENSKRADTSEMAKEMAALCDGEPRFYNLEVKDAWQAEL